jgi:hypothetical protein
VGYAPVSGPGIDHRMFSAKVHSLWAGVRVHPHAAATSPGPVLFRLWLPRLHPALLCVLPHPSTGPSATPTALRLLPGFNVAEAEGKLARFSFSLNYLTLSKRMLYCA